VKTTFVLGAGFSVEERFPLVRGLKRRVIHFLEAEQHESYFADLRIRDGWPEFSDGLFYLGLKCVDPEDRLEFEELLIALSRATNQDHTSVANEVLRIGVARLLWCITFFIHRASAPYENFAYQIASNSDGAAVVSFNWDILVERALTQVNRPWSYAAGDAPTCTPVIKPHGSINWSSFAQDPGMSPLYSAWRPIAPGSTLSFDAAHPLGNPDFEEANPHLRYCLFPGDPDLPGSHPDLARLWADVAQLVTDSDKVVFIGYSLPAYDQFARAELQRLCTSRIVEVIDPCSDALAAFQSQIPHAIAIRQTFGSCQYAQKA